MRRVLVFGSFVAMAVFVVACSDPILPPTQLTVSPSPITLALGESRNLSTALRDEDGEVVTALVSWSSSAPSIVSVTGGFVTALLPGTAEITATAEGVSGTALVRSEDQVAPAVTITSPLAGTTVDGVVTVAVRINDDHKLARVSLSVDGIEVDSTEPAGGTSLTTGLTWNTAGADDGDHLLVVEATDSTGNIGDASVAVIIEEEEAPPFVLSIVGSVSSSGYNTLTQREECTSMITASATGGAAMSRAEWLSGRVEFRDVNGLSMSTVTLAAADLLDYFGSSHIATGATQVANRVDRQPRTDEFDVLYTFRAALPDGTLSSTTVFMDCY